MRQRTVSKLYPKACRRCGGDVLYSAEIEGPDLVCLQAGHRFDQRGAPPIKRIPPDDMTSRIYVEERLSELSVESWTEIHHVDWLVCHGPKDGCTLASAIRDFRRRVPWREYIQKHGYPGIWIKRIE